MRKAFLSALVGILLAAASQAGVTYTATVYVHHDLGGSTDTSKVTVWIDSGKAKAEYVETTLPGVEPGDYLLTLDGGSTVSLVKPGEKTVSPCKIEGVFGILTRQGRALQGLFSRQVEQVEAKLLEQGEGEPVAGQPTVRHKLQLSYLTRRSTPRGEIVTSTVIQQEVWTVEGLEAGPPASWPVPVPLRLPEEELQAAWTPVAAQIKGLPVKAITVRTVTTSEGQERVVEGRFEVLELAVTEIPEAVFAVPDGFQAGEFRANMFSDPTLRIKRPPR